MKARPERFEEVYDAWKREEITAVKAMRMLLGFPNLLAFLYSEWIRRSGGTPGMEELRRSIDESICSLQKKRAVMENEITEEGAA